MYLFQIWKVHESPHKIFVNLVYGRFYFWQNILHLNEAVFLFLKCERDTLFALNFFFHVLVNIWLNFQTTNTYYMLNWQKFHEDSAELDHFALATKEPKLQPRKPVHFFMLQTLSSILVVSFTFKECFHIQKIHLYQF